MASSYSYQAVANGLRTDHPIPDLAFVDDAHLPVDDPQAVEAIGRKPNTKTWGRTDRCRDGGWVAYTTDPARQDLAWVVRWHPEHGRSVVLYRNTDGAGAHMAYGEDALLFRSGGYWWDGTTWYRPAQVFDLARGRYVVRSVPSALTISAADLLDEGAHADRGQALSIGDVDPDKPHARSGAYWRHDLALWAKHHAGGRHTAGCIVQLTAPELAAERLLSAAELAETAGIASSTLRGYLARGEGDIPTPQAIVGGRSMWSRPVAEDWVERRRRSRDAVASTMADPDHGSMAIGKKQLWEWFTQQFTYALWERPDARKRFTLRWRTEPAVRDLGSELAWLTTASLDEIAPVQDLGATVYEAVLGEWAAWQREYLAEDTSYPITPAVARVLDWLIRHEPRAAHTAVADIVGDAERRLQIPPAVAGRSLSDALAVDGELSGSAYDEFLHAVLPPAD